MWKLSFVFLMLLVVSNSHAQMVADVQGWLDNPTTNYGWILAGDESGATSAKRFATREITIPEFRPRLIVFSTDP